MLTVVSWMLKTLVLASVPVILSKRIFSVLCYRNVIPYVLTKVVLYRCWDIACFLGGMGLLILTFWLQWWVTKDKLQRLIRLWYYNGMCYVRWKKELSSQNLWSKMNCINSCLLKQTLSSMQSPSDVMFNWLSLLLISFQSSLLFYYSHETWTFTWHFYFLLSSPDMDFLGPITNGYLKKKNWSLANNILLQIEWIFFQVHLIANLKCIKI